MRGSRPRIDQHLGPQRRASLVAGAQSHRRRQVGARAVAGDRYPGRIAPELPARGGEPARHCPAVLEAGGIRVLRRQAVVHRHDDRVGGPRQAAAHRVVRVEVPEHPSAAVEERHERLPPGGPPAVPPRRPRVAGPVHPHRDRPGRPGNRAVLGRAPVVRLGQRHEQFSEIATPVREREAHARRPSRRDEIVQKGFDLRICGDGRILGPIVRAVKLLPLRWSCRRSFAGPPSSSRCARPRPARPSRRRRRGSPSGSGRGGAAPCGTRCR